jgi:dephospho-CoA kinase
MTSQRPLLVGVTGGIGSGKTSVCKIFESIGVPVYYADDRAKYLVQHHPHLKAHIIKAFGEQSYVNNEYNRVYMAQQVFQNAEKLAELEALIHPVVYEDFDQWVEAHSDAAYLVKEAAIMIGHEKARALNYIIAVIAPDELRIQRVLARDKHRTKQDVVKIMEHQVSQLALKKKADFVLENDNCSIILKKVLELHTFFTK